MNVGLEEYKPAQIALDIDHLPSGVQVENAELRSCEEKLTC